MLILKKRPSWQAGKLNGVGGKIEEGEGPISAMRREFKEETGLEISEWEKFCTISRRILAGDSGSFVCYCYRAFGDIGELPPSPTDEIAAFYKVEDVSCNRSSFVDNTSWLVGLALDACPKKSVGVEYL